MQANQFSVGRLAEMPAEGIVGVSETCVLGYNVNQGQEISLRLRTDDGKGMSGVKCNCVRRPRIG